MRCDEFEPALHHCLDEGVTPADDPQLAEHVASCADCRSKLQSLLVLVEATERSDEPGAPHDLAARVLGELRAVSLAESTPSLRSRRSQVAAWAALAASLMLATFGGYRWGQQQARDELITAAIEAQLQVQTAGATGAANPLGDWPVDPRWLLPQLVQWNPPATLPGGKHVAPRAGADAPLETDVRASLAPVANSATAALDNLWQALSAGSEDTRS